MKPNGEFKILNKKIYLQISYEDLSAIRHIVDIAPKEAQWFHRLKRISETEAHTVYKIYEMYIPEQYCSGAEVESNPEMMIKFYRELVSDHGNDKANDILSDLTVWCHSHHNMGVNPSGQDQKQFKELIKNGQESKVDLPQVMLIFNKKDMFYSKIWDPETGILSENVPILVETPNFDHIDEQAKAKFKKKPAPKRTLSLGATKSYGNQGFLDWPGTSGGYLSQTTAANAKAGRSKKKRNKQASLRPVSSSNKKVTSRKITQYRDEVTELAEDCMMSNNCGTAVDSLMKCLMQICDLKELCVMDLLLNGTDFEIQELKLTTLYYDDDDYMDSQINMHELLIDAVLPAPIISLAFEVAVALQTAETIDEASALIDFWLDAYASAFGGISTETELPAL
jgi:hypothetical protein